MESLILSIQNKSMLLSQSNFTIFDTGVYVHAFIQSVPVNENHHIFQQVLNEQSGIFKQVQKLFSNSETKQAT